MTEPEIRAPGVIRLHGMMFDVAGASAQGPRSENQDAFAVEAFAEAGLVAVADGMGGERAGRLAADTALAALAEGGPIGSLDAARYAVRSADAAVARLAQEAPEERHGMGCALALMALTLDRGGDAGWVGAHVGDVRILSRSPDGTVRLETRDHTPAYARWEAGEIALDEIPDSPGANRLQRAVGRGGEAEATFIPARPGWTYLLISDGVTKAMRLDELGGAMALPSARAACEAIARKVEERGPDDNYTVVAVRVLDDAGGGDTVPVPPARAAAAPTPGAPAAPPRQARPVYNPPPDVTVNRRSSPWGPVAAVLALLALGLGGFALWTALQARDAADPGMAAQVDSLRAELRTLRARVATPGDTLGALPGVVDTARPPAPAGATPAPVTRP